jgi:hypothetical protein
VRRAALLSCCGAALLWCGAARAQGSETAPAAFALIIGVNHGVDPELPTLRYADDDAALYQRLFRNLGARTYVLTRADENTRRLHPQVAAEAGEPTAAGLESAVRQLAGDVAQARQRGVPTVLYVLYAGHGNARDGEGYVALEDARLDGRHLAELIHRIGALDNHLIVDACYSYYLVFSRGPTAAKRRPLAGFATFQEVLDADHVGLLFSTSSARESHEWEAFQAGVFSHEVRSGLLGAADVDGDGRVSYREIAAFIERANQGVPNERFRPDVYARPPRRGDVLVDLRDAQHRRIDLDGTQTGHFLLEDGLGVRWADFHNGGGQSLHLLRPPSTEPLFLRRLSDDSEWTLAPSDEVVTLASLERHAPHASYRGAAHESFGAIFSLPFDEKQVRSYAFRKLDAPQLWLGRSPAAQKRLIAGGTLLGAAVAVALAGMGISLAARDLGGRAVTSQAQAQANNQQIDAYNGGAITLYVAAGAIAVAGSVLLGWPDRKPAAK